MTACILSYCSNCLCQCFHLLSQHESLSSWIQRLSVKEKEKMWVIINKIIIIINVSNELYNLYKSLLSVTCSPADEFLNSLSVISLKAYVLILQFEEQHANGWNHLNKKTQRRNLHWLMCSYMSQPTCLSHNPPIHTHTPPLHDKTSHFKCSYIKQHRPNNTLCFSLYN